MVRAHFMNIRAMRCPAMGMDARRRAKPMVDPLASPTTTQTPHCGATRRDGVILASWRRYSLLMWSNHTASLAPCPEARLAPSHTRRFMK